MCVVVMSFSMHLLIMQLLPTKRLPVLLFKKSAAIKLSAMVVWWIGY